MSYQIMQWAFIIGVLVPVCILGIWISFRIFATLWYLVFAILTGRI